MSKVVGCLLCRYRTSVPAEIDLFRVNGCPNCNLCESCQSNPKRTRESKWCESCVDDFKGGE